ncbi:tetratricopeptide repeat protein [Tenacibaculum sp. 190524A05c]|uniref:tetratricopeptide repeat protein n=1 Tax=Tenacibaculum platacis TaxID=3137852 RepID=UPI0032B1DB28
MSDNRAEDLFFEADQMIEENQIVEAKERLYDLLEEFPDYGRAHNHLGWLYNLKFNNYPKAKKHLELAIKFAPDYHAAYSNYSYLLIDMNLNDEMITFGNKVITNSVVDKSTIYNKMGQAFELKKDLMNAHKYYKLAIGETLNNKTLDSIYASVTRVKRKMSLMQRLKLINQ